MKTLRLFRTRLLVLSGFFCLLTATGLFAADSGNLSGLLLSETGSPLSSVVVALVSQGELSDLPFVTRSNERGRILLKDLESGTYQLLVKSAQYRSPIGRLVEILPDRTVVVTLILQELIDLERDGTENLGVKALLRTSDQGRLIFRNAPVPALQLPGEEVTRSFFEEAVFQVYSNAGFGGDYFVFPGDSSSGTSTNFAVADSFLGSQNYIFAGQLNSGEDSLWRIRNSLDYRLADRSFLRVAFGYGRVGFEQPSLSLLNNPKNISGASDFFSASGTADLVNLEISNQLDLSPKLSVTLGMGVDRVQAERTDVLVSPNARLEYLATESTTVRLTVSSKRPNLGNTLTLPDGQQVTLASPLFLSRVGNQFAYGEERHYRGAVTQALGDKNQVEFAFFENDASGVTAPILAVFELSDQTEVVHVPNEIADARGCRVSVRRDFHPNFRSEFSYVRGQAPGLNGSAATPSTFSGLDGLVGRHAYDVFSTQFDAYIPKSQTQLTALVRFVPSGQPLKTVDVYSDVHQAGNEGINLFVRQVIPIPSELLSFLGLEFLAPQKIEALLDIRNLTNEDMGVLETEQGEVSLLRAPRSVRGGIAFRF